MYLNRYLLSRIFHFLSLYLLSLRQEIMEPFKTKNGANSRPIDNGAIQDQQIFSDSYCGHTCTFQEKWCPAESVNFHCILSFYWLNCQGVLGKFRVGLPTFFFPAFQGHSFKSNNEPLSQYHCYSQGYEAIISDTWQV